MAARKPRPTKAQLAERRAAEWELYCRGWTMPQLAERYGLDVSTISDDLKVYREAIPAQTRESMVERHHTTLADITRRLDALSRLNPPPVVAGKDGTPVMDPETREWVRDYSTQVTALRELRATLAQEAKLAGLNAADKVEVTGSVTFEGSVDAELQELANQLGLQGPVLPPRGHADEVSEGVRGSDADATP
jgi:hypothetical protein